MEVIKLTQSIFDNYKYLSKYPNVYVPTIGSYRRLLDYLIVPINKQHLTNLVVPSNLLDTNKHYCVYIPVLSSFSSQLIITDNDSIFIRYPRMKISTEYSHIGIIITDTEQNIIAAGVVFLVEIKNIIKFKLEHRMKNQKDKNRIGYLKDNLIGDIKLFYTKKNEVFQLVRKEQSNPGLIPFYRYSYYISNFKIEGYVTVLGKEIIIEIHDFTFVFIEDNTSIIIRDEWENVIIGCFVTYERV